MSSMDVAGEGYISVSVVCFSSRQVLEAVGRKDLPRAARVPDIVDRSISALANADQHPPHLAGRLVSAVAPLRLASNALA